MRNSRRIDLDRSIGPSRRVNVTGFRDAQSDPSRLRRVFGSELVNTQRGDSGPFLPPFFSSERAAPFVRSRVLVEPTLGKQSSPASSLPALTREYAPSLSCSTSPLTETAPQQLEGEEKQGRGFISSSEAKVRAQMETVFRAVCADDAAPEEVERRGSFSACNTWHEDADVWLVDLTHAQSLISAGKLVEAYVALSSALTRYGPVEERAVKLRSSRAECSFSLMNFKECIEDCRYVLRTALINLAAIVDITAVTKLCARAHLMREDYDEARAVYDLLLSPNPSCCWRSAAPVLTAAELAMLRRERASLTAVCRFRALVTSESWSAAVAALDDARVLVEDTPLRVLAAIALFESGAVDAARESLLPYLPSLSIPVGASDDDGDIAAAKASREACCFGVASEQRQLRFNIDAHYLLSTALLAKISAYSGRAYMNVAAVLLQRCLRINKAYAPALKLGDYLVKIEDAFTLADQCGRGADESRVLHALSTTLELDPANKRITAALYLRRAEVQLYLRRPLQAVEDCTASIRNDPTVARAFFLRAHLYQQIHRDAEAAADVAVALRLNPSLAAEEDSRQAPLPSSTAPFGAFPTPLRAAAPFAREGRPLGGGEGKRAGRPFPTGHPAMGSSSFPVPPSAAASPPPPPPLFHKSTNRAHRQPRASSTASLYDILGVSSDATLSEIRQSFKRLTLLYHPDRLVNESEEMQITAVEMFKKINNAHSILSDEARRRAYDAILPSPM